MAFEEWVDSFYGVYFQNLYPIFDIILEIILKIQFQMMKYLKWMIGERAQYY